MFQPRINTLQCSPWSVSLSSSNAGAARSAPPQRRAGRDSSKRLPPIPWSPGFPFRSLFCFFASEDAMKIILRRTAIWLFFLLVCPGALWPQQATSSPVLDHLSKGARLTLVDATADSGFYHVRTENDLVGWVWSKFVSVSKTPPIPPSPPTPPPPRRRAPV